MGYTTSGPARSCRKRGGRKASELVTTSDSYPIADGDQGGFPCEKCHAFQDAKMEVPTMYKAHLLGLCKGIDPKIWPYMVHYLHSRILEFPLTCHDAIVSAFDITIYQSISPIFLSNITITFSFWPYFTDFSYCHIRPLINI